jgi:hypothetical protein
MPLYGPKFSETEFRGGKNILASEHLQFIEGGATLDATKFPVGYNDVGKLVARNTTTGKFEAVAEVEDLTGYDNFGILNVDFENDGETDLIAGEVIVRGSVYEAKLADAVTDAFKAANPLIRYVNHI